MNGQSFTIMLLLVTLGAGCSTTSSCQYDIPAVPANRVPVEFLGRPRSEMQQVSISRLRQPPPSVYQLAPDDILGIYIENVLDNNNSSDDRAYRSGPPVHFPESGDQPPAIGYPVPVREDGTLSLPFIDPIVVDGMTVSQATDAIRRAYTIEKKILIPGKDKIIVTLMHRRKHRVIVIREESGGKEGITKRGTGETVDLPAYENDVLHALNETGGMPGLDAKNEIFVIRSGGVDGYEYDALIGMIQSCRQPCECPPELPDPENVTRIPIRYYPEQVPRFAQQDIILETGDIVYIPARDSEKFYTGGVMAGGEHLLPRDYDLDVMKAIAVAGGPVGSAGAGISQIGGQQAGRSSGRPGGLIGPSKLVVLRKNDCGQEIPIEIDLNRAVTDPSHRILVQPEDTLILQYTLHEEIMNTLLSMIQFNILFNGFRGSGF